MADAEEKPSGWKTMSYQPLAMSCYLSYELLFELSAIITRAGQGPEGRMKQDGL
jgi:hypothetical protein